MSIVILAHVSTHDSHGAAGDLDLSFDPGSGVNGRVTDVLVQTDGKVLIAGSFTMAKGLLRTNLARLNADGSGDPNFDAGPTGNSIMTLTLQADGKLIVAGAFPHSYCDESGCAEYYAVSVVRLNADGSRDASFTVVTAEYYSQFGEFSSITLQPDGKILVGGTFTSVSGRSRFGVARLHANGTLDTNFNTGTGPNGAVSSITLQPDGKMFISGSFSTVDGTNRGGLARLNANGSLDLSYNAGMGAIQYPDCGSGVECFDLTNATAVALQADGKVLVGLWSRKYFVQNEEEHIEDRYWMARLLADGSKDPGFLPTNKFAQVGSILIQSDGKLLVRHGFNESQIIRLNANGSGDGSFTPITEPGGVEAVAMQPDGKVLIGGTFATVNGTNRHHLARLNTNGGLDPGFGSALGLRRPTSQLVVQSDGKVLIGGPLVWGSRWYGPLSDVLAFIDGSNQHGRTRLNANGSLDSAPIVPNNFNPQLAWTFRPEDCPGSPYGCSQSALAGFALAQPDGKVLIGGDVETVITGDETLVFLGHVFFARFNADGSVDHSFNPPTNTSATAAVLQPDGKILIGGFISVNGTNSSVARLNSNGSVDGSFQWGQGPGSIRSLALQSDGKIVVGGANTVARLNSNGSRDLAFGSVSLTNGEAYSLALQPDGKILIGGSFNRVNGTNRNRVARLNSNGTLDTSFNPGAGPDGLVRSIALQTNGNVLIGGDFTAVSGIVRPYVARLFGSDAAPALNISRAPGLITLSWPLVTGFVLEQSLFTTGTWSQVSFLYATNGNNVSVNATAPTGNKFFRLRKL
jgi:uncharacterized delta-60 repeat protein